MLLPAVMPPVNFPPARHYAFVAWAMVIIILRLCIMQRAAALQDAMRVAWTRHCALVITSRVRCRGSCKLLSTQENVGDEPGQRSALFSSSRFPESAEISFTARDLFHLLAGADFYKYTLTLSFPSRRACTTYDVIYFRVIILYEIIAANLIGDASVFVRKITVMHEARVFVLPLSADTRR